MPSSIAFRASIVLAAGRSFLFLVRLIERLPVLALPAWARNSSMPVDGRDITDYLVRSATADDALAGRAWDAVGPERMTHGQMMERIADLMMVGRPRFDLSFSMTPVAAPVAAAVAGEDLGLIEPLMESLEPDLLPRDPRPRRVRRAPAHLRRRRRARAARTGSHTEVRAR